MKKIKRFVIVKLGKLECYNTEQKKNRVEIYLMSIIYFCSCNNVSNLHPNLRTKNENGDVRYRIK